jgi:hypothetical protein
MAPALGGLKPAGTVGLLLGLVVPFIEIGTASSLFFLGVIVIPRALVLSHSDSSHVATGCRHVDSAATCETVQALNNSSEDSSTSRIV